MRTQQQQIGGMLCKVTGDSPLPGRPPSRSLSPEENEMMRASFCAKCFAQLLLKLEGLIPQGICDWWI